MFCKKKMEPTTTSIPWPEFEPASMKNDAFKNENYSKSTEFSAGYCSFRESKNIILEKSSGKLHNTKPKLFSNDTDTKSIGTANGFQNYLKHKVIEYLKKCSANLRGTVVPKISDFYVDGGRVSRLQPTSPLEDETGATLLQVMSSAGTLGDAAADDSGEDEAGGVFPQTHIVVKFAAHINASAMLWLVDKIRGKRRDGGAELLVRRQPRRSNEGLILHVTASKIKFLEAAEEMELRKMDSHGLMREFTVSELEDFLEDGMNVDDLLTTAERQRIVRHEIENIRALPEDDHVPGFYQCKLYEGQSIIPVCLHWGLVESLYPLHDVEALDKLGKKWYWAVFRKQPFEEIRLYFGEAIAMYFTFLGFYTTALLAPMLLGCLHFFMSTESLAFFCIFNVMWVTVFLEVWKRKASELAFSWGTIGMTSLDEPRPNFWGAIGVDSITGKMQPQFPRWKTNMRMYCVSLPIVFVCMLGAFYVMLVSFWAEEYFHKARQGDDSQTAQVLVMLPSVVYAALVFVMNAYYKRLATYLTEWENHRTQSQFDRHQITKLVLFEFVNNFMSLFYIAFYIQDMEMLRHQLAVMLIILQAINNFQEALLPMIIRFYGKKLLKFCGLTWFFGAASEPADLEDDEVAREPVRAGSGRSPNAADLREIPRLDKDDPRIELATAEGEMESYEGTYDDYLEMFIQFGYVFLFSSVFPMAAFWAVVNNVLEIRADAFKLCRLCQRPMSRRVKDIGAWQFAFEVVGAMSIMTNCGLLCMSPQLRSLAPGMTTVEWVLMFVFLEHTLLGVRQLLHATIQDRPEWVRIGLAKVNHQSKQALKKERMMKNRRQYRNLRRFKTVHGRHGHDHSIGFNQEI